MVSTSADSHAVSPVPERHCCVCWIIAWFRLKAAAGTNPLAHNPFPACRKKTPDKCDLLHKQSERSALHPGMIRKATQPSFQPSDDIRVDYALIASSLAAGVFALIYLILV
jgi:hypothetical protein